MHILELNINNWVGYITIVALVGGILAWWIAKLLDDKKTMVEHEVKIEDLQRRMSDVEQEVRDLQR